MNFAPLKVIPGPLKINLLLIAFVVNLTIPNKQSFIAKSFLGLHGQLFNTEAMYKCKIKLLCN